MHNSLICIQTLRRRSIRDLCSVFCIRVHLSAVKSVAHHWFGLLVWPVTCTQICFCILSVIIHGGCMGKVVRCVDCARVVFIKKKLNCLLVFSYYTGANSRHIRTYTNRWFVKSWTCNQGVMSVYTILKFYKVYFFFPFRKKLNARKMPHISIRNPKCIYLILHVSDKIWTCLSLNA